MSLDKMKFEFFGKKFIKQEINREKDPHYNEIKRKCFGNLIPSYHENEDYYLTIKFTNIKYAYIRNYFYSDIGTEIYTLDNKNYFFVFQEENLSKKLVSRINKPLHSKEEIYNLWYNQNEISTFDFLIYLNILGNRSFRDITQYPVFPWIFPENGFELLILNSNNENDNKKDNDNDNENINDNENENENDNENEQK